ncbi:MAG: methylated-DNA--[protein]-cysteine S-methyltransferase [Methylococcales bacterium]|nr:methylated-DNA--[protein]-cysteine S-methyltransferase [Methylococcales bacterium]
MTYLIEWVEQDEEALGPKEWVKLNTPAGLLYVQWRSEVICSVTWSRSTDILNTSLRTISELEFNNQASQVIPLKLLKLGTLFQHTVWAEMLKIPWGQTRTYSEIARQLDSAPRAVGNACRANQYPWFIPCHRVVAVSGLGGYSGQTVGPLMNIKETLLSYELMN